MLPISTLDPHGEQVCGCDGEPGGAEPRVHQGAGAEDALQRTELNIHCQVRISQDNWG